MIISVGEGVSCNQFSDDLLLVFDPESFFDPQKTDDYKPWDGTKHHPYKEVLISDDLLDPFPISGICNAALNIIEFLIQKKILFAKSLDPSVNGSIRSKQGGRFEHGFFSGFVSSLGGSYIGTQSNPAVRVAMSAAIGGTAEALGGGKFANGAVTGAYVMMLNHMGGIRNKSSMME